MGAIPRPAPAGSPGASMSDLLTSAQNLVQAVNGAAQAYLNVQGVRSQVGMTAATLVKTGTGRVCMVSVTVAGSAAGAIYDASQTSSLPAVLCIIPNTAGVLSINLPVTLGVVVVPGTGQTVSVSYS